MKKRCFSYVLLVVSSVFLSSCGAEMEYSKDQPFVSLTTVPAGLAPVEDFYDTTINVYEDGKVVLRPEETKAVTIGKDAPVYETTISSEKIEKLEEMIRANKVQRMKEDLSSPSEDGTFWYLTVNWKDESKTVGGLNPIDSGFSQIAAEIQELIPEEAFLNWREEVQEYIENQE